MTFFPGIGKSWGSGNINPTDIYHLTGETMAPGIRIVSAGG
jgi:hypothetical protein